MAYDFSLSELESSDEFSQSSPEVQRAIAREYISQNGTDEVLNQFKTAVTDPEYQALPVEQQDLFRKSYADFYGVDLPLEDVSFGTDVKDVVMSGLAGTSAIPKAAATVAGWFGAEDSKEWLLDVAKTTEDFYKSGISKQGKEVEQQPFLSDQEGKWFGDNAIKKVFMVSSESLPLMIATAPIGGGASAAISKASFLPNFIRAVEGGSKVGQWSHNLITFGASEAGTSALVSAADAGERIEKMPDSVIAKSPVYQELLNQGMDPAVARAELRGIVEEETVKTQFAATLAGSAVAPGGGMAKLFQKGALKKGVIKEGIEGTITEGAQESGQSGLEQLGENITTQQNIDPLQSIGQNVGESAALGAATGGLMGGGMGSGSKLLTLKDAQQIAQNVPLGADPEEIASQIETATNPTGAPHITLGELTPDEIEGISATQQKLSTADLAEIDRIQRDVIPILREKNPLVSPHIEKIVNERAKVLQSQQTAEFNQVVPNVEAELGAMQPDIAADDLMDDWADTETDVQDQADTRGRSVRFEQLKERLADRLTAEDELKQNSTGAPSTAEESAATFAKIDRLDKLEQKSENLQLSWQEIQELRTLRDEVGDVSSVKNAEARANKQEEVSVLEEAANRDAQQELEQNSTGRPLTAAESAEAIAAEEPTEVMRKAEARAQREADLNAAFEENPQDFEDALMNDWTDDAVSLQQREDQKVKPKRFALPPGQGFELLTEKESAKRLGRKYGVQPNDIKLLPNGQGFELIGDSKTSGGVVKRKNGTPFKRKSDLEKTAKNRGIDLNDYDIREFRGGYIAIPKPREVADETTPETGSAETGKDIPQRKNETTEVPGNVPGTGDVDGGVGTDRETSTQTTRAVDGFRMPVLSESTKDVTEPPAASLPAVETRGVTPPGPSLSRSIVADQEVNTEPTEKQAEKGNYKKGHVSLDGLNISIENPVGSTRKGTDTTGRAWEQKLTADYGYLRETMGHDKDHLDIFIKPGYTGGATDVFVVNQYRADGTFDEQKTVLGVATEQEALDLYRSNYEDGWTGGRSVTRVPMETFRKWATGTGPAAGPLVRRGTVTAGPTGARKQTKEGAALVEAARLSLKAIIDNPDIVGKQRADRIKNGKNLVQFLQANAARKLETGYHKGDRIAFTGEDAPEGFRSFIYLEGHRAGEYGVTRSEEAKATDAAKVQTEFKEQQDQFRKLKEPDAPRSSVPAPDKPAPADLRGKTTESEPLLARDSGYKYRVALIPAAERPASHLKYQIEVAPEGSNTWESALMAVFQNPRDAAKRFIARYKGDLEKVDAIDPDLKREIESDTETKRAEREKTRAENEKSAAKERKKRDLRARFDTAVSGLTGKFKKVEYEQQMGAGKPVPATAQVLGSLGYQKADKGYRVVHPKTGFAVDAFDKVADARSFVLAADALGVKFDTAEEASKKGFVGMLRNLSFAFNRESTPDENLVKQLEKAVTPEPVPVPAPAEKPSPTDGFVRDNLKKGYYVKRYPEKTAGRDAGWQRVTAVTKNGVLIEDYRADVPFDHISHIRTGFRGSVIYRDGKPVTDGPGGDGGGLDTTLEAPAYHGTPHTVDRFSTDKIGTGEGAQAYGWGLYFASSKEVAEWYKDRLSKYREEDAPAAIQYLKDKGVSNDPEADWGYRNKVDYVVLAVSHGFEAPSTPGKLYKVELAPAEDEYLLWDKPLSEQSAKVKGSLQVENSKLEQEFIKLRSKKYPSGRKVSPDWTEADEYRLGYLRAMVTALDGRTKYERLSKDLGGDRAASEYLHSLGIRGIKYLDGTSRSSGAGAYNYVIFNDADVSITDILASETTRREFIQRGGALIAWAAAGGDITAIADTRSFNDILAQPKQTVHGALSWIASNSSSPRFRTMAEDLLTLLPDDAVTLTVTDTRTNAAGTATTDRKAKRVAITLYGDGHNEATLLHESWHAAVLARYDMLNYYLANPGKLGNHQAEAALKQYRAVWEEFGEAVKAYGKGRDDLPHWLKVPAENPDEFLTYALTNPETIDWMSEREYKGKTLRERFLQAIRGFFARMLRRAPTWLDAANMATSDLIAAMKRDAPNFEASARILELAGMGKTDDVAKAARAIQNEQMSLKGDTRESATSDEIEKQATTTRKEAIAIEDSLRRKYGKDEKGGYRTHLWREDPEYTTMREKYDMAWKLDQQANELRKNAYQNDKERVKRKADFFKKAASILKKGKYEFYGLRVNSDNPVTGEPVIVSVGSTALPSYYRPDGNVTDTQHGTSAVLIRDLEKTWLRVQQYIENGSKIVLLGSNTAEDGNDPQEIEMDNAVILAIYDDEIGDTTPDTLSSVLYAQAPPPATSTRPDRIDRLNLSDQWERFIYNVIDKDDPRRRVLKRADVVNLSENLSENTDILTIERLRGKKTAEEGLRFWEDKAVPLLKRLAGAKLAAADLDEYAHAKHAPERNKRMQQVNAKAFIDRIAEHLNSAERQALDDEIIDIRSDVLMTGGTRSDRQDRYLQVLDRLMTGIAAQRADVATQQRDRINNRQFTPAEIAKGTPANIQAELDSRSKHIDNIEKIRDRWELESPRFAGITDTEAAAIVTKWQADSRFAALQDAHQRLLEFGQMKLDILRESGQLTDVEYKSLVDGYEFYVPLMRDVETDDRPATGRITGPTGSPIKVAKGSMLEVVHILAHSIQNVQTAINRKHKADGGRVLYNFAVANPDAGITIEKQKKEPRHDSEGNVVMFPSMKEADNQLPIRVDGERYILTFDTKNATTKRFLESIKEADAGLSGPMQALGKLVRILAMVNTTLAPEFIISNFTRDIQTAGVHLEDTEAKGLQAKVLRNVFPAIKGILGAEYGKAGTYWGRVYRDFAANGGKIGWMQSYDGIKDLAKQIESTMDLHRDGHYTKKSLRTIADLITRTNTAVENGVRLAVYDQLIKAGATPSRAALAASNLTVDFTRRGAYSPVLNSLYMFFNAGVQGNVRMVKAFAHSSRVRAITGGIVLAGFALQFLAYATGGDDETGQPYIDGIPDFIRERNMIIMYPGTDGKYQKIPMPYGYNLFYNIGASMARAAHALYNGKKYEPGKEAVKLVTMAMNSFNPLQAATMAQALSPTVLDPVIMIGENKNWAGMDLMPKESPFGPSKADAYRVWKSTSGIAKSVSQGLHRLTGGKGEYDNTAAVDVSPEVLELMYETFTGSAGRFLKDIVVTPIQALTSDEPVDPAKVPFLRRAYGEWSPRSISTRYYEQAEQVERFRKDYLAADAATRKELSTDSRYKMLNYTRETENTLDKLREARNKAEKAGKPTKLIEERIVKLQTEYLKRGEL